MPEQRLRLHFRKGERVRFISHLDTLRYWERAIRRAGMPLAYSRGFTPHPRLAFAGPLPLGFLAEREILDVSLDERVNPITFRRAVSCQLTEDIAIVDIAEVPLAAPSPQASLRWADYAVTLPAIDLPTAIAAVERFLDHDTFEWVDDRRDKPRTLDLRDGTASLRARPDVADGTRLEMRLRAEQSATIRPEMIVAAVFPGAEPARITRLDLRLEEPSPAREAWRRRGRYL